MLTLALVETDKFMIICSLSISYRKRRFFRDFSQENIKIEQFSRRTCKSRLMFAASQTSLFVTNANPS